MERSQNCVCMFCNSKASLFQQRDGGAQIALHSFVFQNFNVWGFHTTFNQKEASVVIVEKYKFHFKNYFFILRTLQWEILTKSHQIIVP